MKRSLQLRTLPHECDPTMVNLSSNDYLGLSDDVDLQQEFLDSVNVRQRSLLTAASSRLLTGNHSAYDAVETTLSNLYDGRSALFFNCGYHVNSGVLPALLDKRDLILADKLSHASLIDGFRLSDATLMRFRHNDMSHLRHILSSYRADYERCVIVTESIFSMDGDAAPLTQLAELKLEFDCWLYVDEAHAVGVRGPRGEGLSVELGLLQTVDLLVGTCGKALASQGAFLISNADIHDFLVSRCRTLIFTTALPPINVAWTDFVLRSMERFSSRRDNLRKLSAYMSRSLGVCSDSQIIPFICGSNDAAVSTAARCRDAGFYVLPIRHPTVPLGTARLRLSLKANMEPQSLNPLTDLLCNIKNSMP